MVIYRRGGGYKFLCSLNFAFHSAIIFISSGLSPFYLTIVCIYQVTSAPVRVAKPLDKDDDPSPPSLAPPQEPPPSPLADQQQQQQPTDSEQPAAQEGYDVEVVNDTGAYDCLVCHLIPRDPMQVSCCGKRFCRTCITRVLSDKNVCPHCLAKGDTFQVFEDEGQRQATLELMIYCPNKKQGCSWSGELCHRDTHLNSDLAKDSSEGCQYLELKCIHCSKHLPRHHMHSCPHQQYTCLHCKHYSASYRDVNSHHVAKCELFPVSCPFCGRRKSRKDFDVHKTNCLQRRPLQGMDVRH